MLLSLCSPDCARAAGPPLTMASGIVAAVNGATLAVRQGDKPLATYNVSPATKILIDGKVSQLAALMPGYVVNVQNAGDATTAIYARTPDTEAWGVVTVITDTAISIVDRSGDGHSFSISPATAVTLYTKPAKASNIKSGMLTDIKFTLVNPNAAVSVSVVRPDGGVIRGKITAVSSASITLETLPGSTMTLKIDPAAAVLIDMKPAKLSLLTVGEQAEVTAVDGATATAISAMSLPGKGDNARKGR